MVLYLLKANIALALFYAFYRLLFAQDTFFRLRRALLDGFWLLAFAYPLLDGSGWMPEEAMPAAVTVMRGYMVALPEVLVDGRSAEVSSSLPTWAALYIGVMALLLARVVIRLAGIVRLASRSGRARIEGIPVRLMAEPAGPFSFFGWIFVHPGGVAAGDLREILIHERTHARQGHSFDILLAELVTCLCWINPFVWLLRREVRYNLEYLADESVLRAGYDAKGYQYHLLGLAYHKAAARLYTHFNVSILKNRIRMMNKQPSQRIGMAKLFLLFPLVACLVLLSDCKPGDKQAKEEAPAEAAMEEIVVVGYPGEDTDVPAATAEDQVFMVVEQMPQFPGGQEALMKFLAQNLRYPEEARKAAIQGRVIASFVVRKDGSLTDIEVMRGVNPSLDDEAIRVIKSMPKWEPGKQRGQAVSVKYTVPVTFRLQ